ncbi:MAG: hypothetical protein ACRD1X_02735 [Vicinamibacteria bacterium]
MKLLSGVLEDPIRFARMKRWFYGSLAAAALGEILVPRLFPADHAHFWFEDLPAWGSVYGLVSCIAIIKVSKLLGELWLMRPEDYYDR